MGTIAPADGSVANWCGRPWTVNAPRGSLALNGANLRATVRPKTHCALDVGEKRHPMPERAFLTAAGWHAGIGADQPTHISFGLTVLLGKPVSSQWVDLFQLMPTPDRDPKTRAWVEPFPSPMLGLYLVDTGAACDLSWQTRYEPAAISQDTNPNLQERVRVPFVRGKRVAITVDLTDSRGQPGGALKIVHDGAVVFKADDTPIGFNNATGSYPSVGAYCGLMIKPADLLDVLVDTFTLTAAR